MRASLAACQLFCSCSLHDRYPPIAELETVPLSSFPHAYHLRLSRREKIKQNVLEWNHVIHCHRAAYRAPRAHETRRYPCRNETA
jgi:hypothetical protein